MGAMLGLAKDQTIYMYQRTDEVLALLMFSSQLTSFQSCQNISWVVLVQ